MDFDEARFMRSYVSLSFYELSKVVSNNNTWGQQRIQLADVGREHGLSELLLHFDNLNFDSFSHLGFFQKKSIRLKAQEWHKAKSQTCPLLRASSACGFSCSG